MHLYEERLSSSISSFQFRQVNPVAQPTLAMFHMNFSRLLQRTHMVFDRTFAAIDAFRQRANALRTMATQAIDDFPVHLTMLWTTRRS